MAQEQLRFLLLNYSKTLGKYKRVRYPRQQEKEVRGNVLITVPLSYVEEFNISHSLPLSIIQGKWKAHQRSILNNEEGVSKITSVREYEKSIRTGIGKLATVKKIKANSSYLNPDYQLKQYYFRFPYFFNLSMIDQSLFSILKNDSQIERFRFFVNGKSYELTGEETGWGTAKISNVFIESNDHPSKKWGDISIIKYKVR